MPHKNKKYDAWGLDVNSTRWTVVYCKTQVLLPVVLCSSCSTTIGTEWLLLIVRRASGEWLSGNSFSVERRCISLALGFSILLSRSVMLEIAGTLIIGIASSPIFSKALGVSFLSFLDFSSARLIYQYYGNCMNKMFNWKLFPHCIVFKIMSEKVNPNFVLCYLRVLQLSLVIGKITMLVNAVVFFFLWFVL